MNNLTRQLKLGGSSLAIITTAMLTPGFAQVPAQPQGVPHLRKARRAWKR